MLELAWYCTVSVGLSYLYTALTSNKLRKKQVFYSVNFSSDDIDLPALQAKRSRVEEDEHGNVAGSRDSSRNGTGSGNGLNDPRWSGQTGSGPARGGGGGTKVPVFKNSSRDSSSLELIYFLLYIEEVCCS